MNTSTIATIAAVLGVIATFFTWLFKPPHWPMGKKVVGRVVKITLAATLGIGVTIGAYFLLSAVFVHHPTIGLGCKLSTEALKPGATFQMTYEIHSNEAVAVGLGAALYDNQGTDHSTGYGDIDSTLLPIGQSSESRPVLIPSGLPAGRYEVDAEIWPNNEVGQNGANTLADATCAFFNVR